MLSDTTDMDSPGTLAALLMSSGSMPNVLPAEVPPGTIRVLAVSFDSLRIAVVTWKPSAACVLLICGLVRI